ncbi:MAG: methionyl-tRNA formyltransferase [Candidatus Bipolaricaulota bacterium]
MRVVFLGTSSFAVPTLSALAAHHDVRLVVTQPDRPAGRHACDRQPAVKCAARDLGLPICQADRVHQPETLETLRAASPEALVVAAFGQILKPAVFGLAPFGAINLHASLLPKYRGAAPVNWAIVRGETETGVTTFVIDAGMDTGPMLVQRALPIAPDETAGDLEVRLAELGAGVMLKTLDGLLSGTISPRPQPQIGASLAPKLARDDGRIVWGTTAREAYDFVRGMTPWPGAWGLLDGQRVKVHRAARTGISVGPLAAGQIGPKESRRLLVACSDEFLELCDVQREAKGRTSGREFLNGLRGGAAFS